MPDALQFLVLTVVGWVNRHQEDLIDYLREENRILLSNVVHDRFGSVDAQRRRLAVRGKRLGRRALVQVAGIVTPDTILRWYRKLIAQKCDGSPRRRRGRLMTRRDIADLVVQMAGENPQWGSGACPNLDPTSLRGAGSRLVLRSRAPALTAAAHDNETAALSLFEQPFCSGVQGAKVTLLRVRALRRIAKSSGPTAGGQRIDRTGDLVAAKDNEERAGADTRGLSARRVVLGTLQEVTVRHHGRVQTIVTWAGGQSLI